MRARGGVAAANARRGPGRARGGVAAANARRGPGTARGGIAAAVAAAIGLVAPAAGAAPGTTFGAGPRVEALARSTVAEGDTTDAATENAAFSAAEGTRVRFGYGASGMFLRVNDRDAGVAPVAGLDVAGSAGARLASRLWLGTGFALHLPAQIARIAFRPATEPQFVLYEAAQQRLSLDLVASLRWGPIAVGGGSSVALGVGGPGVGVDVAQDANGPHAQGALDIGLGYRLAPLVGVVARLGRLQLGASFRGELAVDLSLDTVVKVDLEGNPLNGVTTVILRGPSGYEPPRVDLGARVLVARGLRAFAAVEYDVYSAAPAPVADATIDVDLATKPALGRASFVEPRFRDTVSPRLGVEWRHPSAPLPPSFLADTSLVPDPWRVALRAGYAYEPSPVPAQTGFTSYADSARHAVGLGAAYHVGEVLGIDVTVSAAAQVHALERRQEKKPSPALPFAEYSVSGEMVRGSIALEGFVR